MHLEAAQGPAWAFTAVAAVFFLASVGWVLSERRRLGHWLAGLALLGGLVASFEEAWISRMIQLFYPADSPLVGFTAHGHPQPLYVQLVYPGFVGLGAYVVYRALLAHPDGRLLWPIFSGICLLDLAFELPATTANVFAYYGDQPFQFFAGGWPLWVAPINAVGPVLAGWMIYRLAPQLDGSRRLLLALCPPLAYAGVYGAAGWPTYTMLNSDVPTVVLWAGGALTMAFCVGIMLLVMTTLPARRDVLAGAPDSRPRRAAGLEATAPR